MKTFISKHYRLLRRFRPLDIILPVAFSGAWFCTKMELAARTLPQVEQQAKVMLILPASRGAIHLEVAPSDRDRALGLMYRRSLQRNAGMLFPLPHSYVPKVWMKHVHFPLDIVFIKQGRIESIVHSAPPCQSFHCPIYSPVIPVDTVLELPGGRARELKLTVGSKAILTPLPAHANPLQQHAKKDRTTS